MEEHGLSREEAERLNGWNHANIRQVETNLRMALIEEERKQTLGVGVDLIERQGLGWWAGAQHVCSPSFVRIVDDTLRQRRQT